MNRESKPRGFQQPITIKEAIEKIEKIGEGKLLLPAIQLPMKTSREIINFTNFLKNTSSDLPKIM